MNFQNKNVLLVLYFVQIPHAPAVSTFARFRPPTLTRSMAMASSVRSRVVTGSGHFISGGDSAPMHNTTHTLTHTHDPLTRRNYCTWINTRPLQLHTHTYHHPHTISSKSTPHPTTVSNCTVLCHSHTSTGLFHSCTETVAPHTSYTPHTHTHTHPIHPKPTKPCSATHTSVHDQQESHSGQPPKSPG